ncbi:MAG: RNA polymerase sigma factor [Candidatus Kapaibacterium sp.]
MNKKLDEYSDSELFYMLTEDHTTAEEAFAELYTRHSPRIYAYCRRFLNDRAEAQDVFQDTFIKFYKSADKSREMTNVSAYILRIARNLCVNALKKDKNKVTYEDYMGGVDDDSHEKDELLKLIRRSLELLPDDYREAFIMREYQGLSYNEIAVETGISLSAVKVRIYRARQKIREVLQPYLEDLSKHE